jgi:hypothetical protein
MTLSTRLKATTIASLAVLALCGTASAKVATGSTVSDLQVTDSNGTVHNLSDFAGKNVVLEWTNHGCPYVKKHYVSNNMQKLQKEAVAGGDTVWLSVISSAPGKQGYVSGEQANELTTSRDAAPTAVILDGSGDAGRVFSARTTPHMYVINADQTLVYQGAIDDNRSANPADAAGARNYVREALSAVKSGGEVAVPETAPYGCSVKYGS